jgi:hypothetical protein
MLMRPSGVVGSQSRPLLTGPIQAMAKPSNFNNPIFIFPPVWVPSQIDFDPDRIDFNPIPIDVNPDQIDFNPDQIDFNPDQIDFNPDQIDFNPGCP